MRNLLPLIFSAACITWAVMTPLNSGFDGVVVCVLYLAGAFLGIKSLYREEL